MNNKILFLCLALTAGVSRASALDFDGKAANLPLRTAYSSIETPAPAAPADARAELVKGGCRPFLLELSVYGMEETVALERACTPENQPVMALRIDRRGAKDIFVRVTSEGEPVIEKRLRSMVVEGMTSEDADYIVNATGPLLRRAAGTADPEARAALLAGAAGQLKAYLKGAAPAERASRRKSRVDCVVKVNGHRNTVSFAVAGLGSAGAELVSLGKTQDDGPILEGKDNREIRSMNDQGGDLRAGEKTLELVGDGDGCSFVRLVLFKDSGYTRGWASESGSEMPHWYTTDVACTVGGL